MSGSLALVYRLGRIEPRAPPAEGNTEIAAERRKAGVPVSLPIVRSKCLGTEALHHAAICGIVFPDINLWVALAHEGQIHHGISAEWFETLSSDATLTFRRFTAASARCAC